MSKRRLKNKKRHTATFEKRKRKSKTKAIIYIMAIICLLVGSAFWGWYIIKEVNLGENYAKAAKELMKTVILTVIVALIPALMGLWISMKGGDKNILQDILVIACVGLFILLFAGMGLTAYAFHRVAEYETGVEPGGEEGPEFPDEPQPLKEFKWMENIYVLNLEEYLGVGAEESAIGGLLLDYLANPLEVTEISKGEYEKNIESAEGFHNDFDAVSMTKTKLFALQNEINAREKADENYSDSDNLKLKGDCLMNLGDIQPKDAVGLYEDALRNYIEALHIVYCYGEDRHPAIGKKDIWEAIGNTYGKLARRSDVQGVERESAEMLEGICAYILQNSL